MNTLMKKNEIKKGWENKDFASMEVQMELKEIWDSGLSDEDLALFSWVNQSQLKKANLWDDWVGGKITSKDFFEEKRSPQGVLDCMDQWRTKSQQWESNHIALTESINPSVEREIEAKWNLMTQAIERSPASAEGLLNQFKHETTFASKVPLGLMPLKLNAQIQQKVMEWVDDPQYSDNMKKKAIMLLSPESLKEQIVFASEENEHISFMKQALNHLNDQPVTNENVSALNQAFLPKVNLKEKEAKYMNVLNQSFGGLSLLQKNLKNKDLLINKNQKFQPSSRNEEEVIKNEAENVTLQSKQTKKINEAVANWTNKMKFLFDFKLQAAQSVTKNIKVPEINIKKHMGTLQGWKGSLDSLSLKTKFEPLSEKMKKVKEDVIEGAALGSKKIQSVARKIKEKNETINYKQHLGTVVEVSRQAVKEVPHTLQYTKGAYYSALSAVAPKQKSWVGGLTKVTGALKWGAAITGGASLGFVAGGMLVTTVAPPAAVCWGVWAATGFLSGKWMKKKLDQGEGALRSKLGHHFSQEFFDYSKNEVLSKIKEKKAKEMEPKSSMRTEPKM